MAVSARTLLAVLCAVLALLAPGAHAATVRWPQCAAAAPRCSLLRAAP
jgi:hypothetical protein